MKEPTDPTEWLERGEPQGPKKEAAEQRAKVDAARVQRPRPSSAPAPLEPIRGGGYTAPFVVSKARWKLWRLIPTVELWQAILLSLDIEPAEGLRDEAVRSKPERSPWHRHRLPSGYFDRLMVCKANIAIDGPIRPQGGLYSGMLTDARCRVLVAEVGAYLAQSGSFTVPGAMRAVQARAMPAASPPPTNSGTTAHIVTLKGAPRARWTVALERLLPELEAQLKQAAKTREVARYLKENGAGFYIRPEGKPDQLYWTTEQGDKKLVTKKTLQNRIAEYRKRKRPPD